MKILVVEDDADLREIIVRSLEQERYVVSQASTYRFALQKIEDYDYDCILLDIMLPDGNGLDLLDELQSLGKRVSVIILSAKDSIEDKVKGLDLGADDYLPKPFEPKELVLRIKSILKRAPKKTLAKQERLDLGLCVYDIASKELLTKQGQVIHITPVEQSLLSILGQRFGQVFSREKLAEMLGAGQSPRSIDVQITRLRKKIEKDSKNPRYLQTVRGKGYMLLPG